MSSALSTKLSAVEVLHVTINKSENILWRSFYQHYPKVKVLRTGGVNNHDIARTLHHDHGMLDDFAFLPALEEIDLGKKQLDESERGSQLAAFQPFVAARQQAGRPVKVSSG
jgi:hypothetical protein